MQIVSNEYKEAMKSTIRPKGHIQVFFGLINQEATQHAYVHRTGDTYYSFTDNVLNRHEGGRTYATLEQGFSKVDGSMYFLSREKANCFNSDITSANIIGEPYTLEISLNIPATEIKGFTIIFDEVYPVDFDIVGETNTISIIGNDKVEFTTDRILESTTKVSLVVKKMSKPNTRARIHFIEFGYGLTYTNNDVIESSLESYVSPIGADIPQIDFNVKLKNFNKYFDVDNPDSAIHFFETGQPLSVYYGLELADHVEWVKASQLECSDWIADDKITTINATDALRSMESEYYKGIVAHKSFYELAESVLSDLNVTDYIIDPSLQTLFTDNPIPRVKHKEALQIIANACRCTLSQNRDGKIVIAPVDDTPSDFTMTRKDMLSYPKATKQELVKRVTVPALTFQSGSAEESLISQDISVSAGDLATFFTDNAAYGYRTDNATITNSGCYFVTVKFNSAFTGKIEIFGHKYTITERYAVNDLNVRGKNIRWKNPLISDYAMANDLAVWLGEYHSGNVEYEYSTRGNPELDCLDVIAQDNNFAPGMNVKIIEQKLDFNQVFEGKVKARRVGGVRR